MDKHQYRIEYKTKLYKNFTALPTFSCSCVRYTRFSRLTLNGFNTKSHYSRTHIQVLAKYSQI